MFRRLTENADRIIIGVHGRRHQLRIVNLSHGTRGAHRIFFQGRAIGGGRSQWLGSTMASAEHEPITGVWGRAPSGVQGQSSWSGGQGAKPP